jgi:hypothetical protein
MKFLRALILAALLPAAALAQVVTQLPVAVSGNSVVDLGNGPTELKIVQGNALLFTMQGSGVGSTSGSATLLTLTGTPTTPPCVGCVISGTGITSGTTVSAFNGTTSVTLSAAMTVAASTPVAWGAACPSSIGAVPSVPIRAAVGGDWPLYTQARVCAAASYGPGAALLPFAIGAH